MEIWIYLTLFSIAVSYSIVGHGGASGYMTLMSLIQIPSNIIRSTVLLMNILVAGMAFFFYKKHHFHSWKLSLPLITGSIPGVFFGALLNLSDPFYRKVLAAILIIGIIRLLIPDKKDAKTHAPPFLQGALIGLLIGWIAGLIGIGGGILLSPIIMILKWGDSKQTAATSAVFILINSIIGLSVQLGKGIPFHENTLQFSLCVLVGGIIGGYLGASKLHQKWVKNILLIGLAFGVIKLILM